MFTTSHRLLAYSFIATGLVAAERYQASEPHMGSLATITLYADSPDQAQRAFLAAFGRIAELNRILSDYDPESELSRACQSDTRPSPDLLTIVAKAQHLAVLTNGAFDITAAPLTHLWRRARKSKLLPAHRAIADALARSGYKKLEIDHGSIRCNVAGMRLDAGGIAKGYAADEALSSLRKLGILSALVALSGDIAIGDRPPERDGWKIQVLGKTHVLSNCAVSTSGDEFQSLTLEGRRYSHIVDPRTGMALSNSRTVAVIASKAVDADAIATAASVAGASIVDKLSAEFNAQIFIQ